MEKGREENVEKKKEEKVLTERDILTDWLHDADKGVLDMLPGNFVVQLKDHILLMLTKSPVDNGEGSQRILYHELQLYLMSILNKAMYDAQKTLAEEKDMEEKK